MQLWKKWRTNTQTAESAGEESEKHKAQTATDQTEETAKAKRKWSRFWQKTQAGNHKKEKAALTAKEKMIFYAAGAGILFFLSWLFFESWLMGAVLLPLLFLSEERAAEEMEQRKRQKWEDAFGKYLTELDSQIRLGRSLESGMSEALSNGGLFAEEDWMLQKLEMNVAAADIFNELAKRKPVEGLKYFAAALDSSLQSGGNLHELMQNSLIQIQKKLQMEKEISSMLTKIKYESRLLTLFVPFLLLYLKALSPNFRQVMYQTLQGRMVMGVCLGIYLLASYLCYSMTQVEL